MDDVGFDRIKRVLGEMLFFEDFSEDDLDFFSKNVSLRYFPKDTVLFNEGDIGDFLFFVVEGMVDVRIKSKDAKQINIANFQRGACVGEMSLLDNFTRSATIVVTEPSELLIFTRNRFRFLCKDNPAVGLKFIMGIAKNLSLRLRKTSGRFADLA